MAVDEIHDIADLRTYCKQQQKKYLGAAAICQTHDKIDYVRYCEGCVDSIGEIILRVNHLLGIFEEESIVIPKVPKFIQPKPHPLPKIAKKPIIVTKIAKPKTIEQFASPELLERAENFYKESQTGKSLADIGRSVNLSREFVRKTINKYKRLQEINSV